MGLRRALRNGCGAVALLAIAGCSLRGDDPATPTPENVFVVVTPTPGTPEAATSEDDRPTSYTVQEGDNLSDIADQLGVSMRDLQEANDIDDPDTIYAGQVLIVPTPEP